MKTRYISLALLVLISLSSPAQDTESPHGGLAESLIQIIEDPGKGTINLLEEAKDKGKEAYEKIKEILDTPEAREALRWANIFENDIRLKMKIDATSKKFDLPDLTQIDKSLDSPIYKEEYDKSTLYAKYDWDNRAMMMKISSGSSAYVLLHEDGLGFWAGNDKNSTHKQYTDIDGYWYVPVIIEGQEEYVKFNGFKMLSELRESLVTSILGFTVFMEHLEPRALGMYLHYKSMLDGIPDQASLDNTDIISVLEFSMVDYRSDEQGEELKTELQEQLKKGLEKFQNAKIKETYGLPVFIHWALIYSPDKIKALYNVTETTVTHRKIPGCTKLTVKEGEKEAGASVVFDPVGRLLAIRDLEKSTADYYYDRDVTVTLPESYNWDLFGKGNLQKKKEWVEVTENIEKQKRKIEEEQRKKSEEKREEQRQKELEDMKKSEEQKLRDDMENATFKKDQKEAAEKLEDLQENTKKDREKAEEEKRWNDVRNKYEEKRDAEERKENAQTQEEMDKIQKEIDQIQSEIDKMTKEIENGGNQ